ncbi:hypothetical protein LUZ60_012675 [Juncus effusus]|nr:hypothetical protein LUZ60_012675 [Juncus effusus]
MIHLNKIDPSMHCSSAPLRSTSAPLRSTSSLSSGFVRTRSRPCVKFVELEGSVRRKRSLLSMNSSSSNAGSESSVEKIEKNSLGQKDGVIIVDHGSRREESNLMLNEFVTMFKSRTNYEIVEPAHMELAEPSIRVAFANCVKQGAKRIIVSPFFLFPGRHWQRDIPALVAEASKDHEGISYLITAPLGLHELLVDVMNDRINHCLKHVSGVAPECDVCAGTGKCRIYS